MKRREFCKDIVILPASAALASVPRLADAATTGQAVAAGKAAPAGSSEAGKTADWKAVPDFADKMLTSDMEGLGPDGKPTGMQATFTGASRANTVAEQAMKHKMKLTKAEEAILNGSEGEEKAKLMKILVDFGNAFGAEELVDLGGAPHSNMFIGAEYMRAMIDMLEQCVDAGLKSYATYTVNPRPYDVYNVQNNPQEMKLIYQGYPLQARLDYIHSQLGAPDLNLRTCACYIDEVGNAPEPGTYVAWAESSAVNYGNSVLGIRTNRNGAGMDLIQAMLGKAPKFGLMSDEGRKAQWLIEVKTSKEPDWGTLGTAIGRKVVEDVTPEPKEKGRDLLARDYQTYVYDDKEQQAIIDTFENLWPDKDGDPTAAFIGCPHNTYHEIKHWGEMILAALDKAGREKTAIPVYFFCVNKVRDRMLSEETELTGRMFRAGMSATNMCAVVYSGMKGFSERVRGITNSAKTRAYSNIRYFPDQILVNAIVTGKIKA